MKILLITPVKNPNVKKPRGIMMPQLALNLLEGLTPPEHEVTLVEEEIEDIDLEASCDLVGISSMTSNAPRAYYLADEFRKRGKKVVLGGVHPTILPDEALDHADSVVVGEAEGVWRDLLEDFKGGRLKKKYHKPHPSLDEYVRIKHRTGVKKRMFNVVPVMTTRGCPYNCEFCCVHDLYGKKVRHIPVENVVRDIVDSEGKQFMFLDDNIIGDKRYARELFSALKPLNIKWGGQASISFVQDTEFMKMASDSGCKGLFFGLESVSKSQMQAMRKSLKEIGEVEDAIKKVMSFGIFFHASMIFGFDDDTTDIFPETLDFLNKNNIGSASLNILTPYPGTQTYRKFRDQGRLISHDWAYYDHNTVVYRPKNMSPIELQAGRLWAVSEFTKMSASMKRLLHNTSHPLLHMGINMGSRKSINNEIRNFPQLASRLYTPELNDVLGTAHVPLSSIHLSDFIPRRNQLPT